MDEECIHGMNPEWCANCKGLKTPEEEQERLDDNFEEMLESWTNS